MDDRRDGVRGNRDGLDPIEHCADRTRVLLQRARDRRRVPQDVDALRGGDCQERRDGSRENECCTIDALVINDDTRAGAETARRVEAVGNRTNQHVYLRSLCDMRFSR